MQVFSTGFRFSVCFCLLLVLACKAVEEPDLPVRPKECSLRIDDQERYEMVLHQLQTFDSSVISLAYSVEPRGQYIQAIHNENLVMIGLKPRNVFLEGGDIVIKVDDCLSTGAFMDPQDQTADRITAVIWMPDLAKRAGVKHVHVIRKGKLLVIDLEKMGPK